MKEQYSLELFDITFCMQTMKYEYAVSSTVLVATAEFHFSKYVITCTPSIYSIAKC